MRGGSVIVSHYMNANFEVRQARVEQRGNIQIAIAARYEDVGRAVIWRRELDFIDAGGNAHHEVAEPGLQRIFEERFSFSPPRVFQVSVQIRRNDLGETILQTLARLIRNRKIIRLRAYS